MEQLKVNSLTFVDTLRELNVERAIELRKLSSLFVTIKKERTHIKAYSSALHIKENIDAVQSALETIENCLSRISLTEQRIRDLEETICQVLELCVAECNLSVGISRRIDSIGEIYDKQENIIISADTALGVTNVLVSDLLIAKKVAGFFGVPPQDINIVK